MLHATFAYAKLPAIDIERARRFYEQKLGLHPFAASPRGDHLYYEVGDVRFMIFASTGRPSGTHDQLGFVVADVEQALAELRHAGVVFEENDHTSDGIADFGAVRAAWCKDSEGNLLNIIEGTSPLWA